METEQMTVRVRKDVADWLTERADTATANSGTRVTRNALVANLCTAAFLEAQKPDLEDARCPHGTTDIERCQEGGHDV